MALGNSILPGQSHVHATPTSPPFKPPASSRIFTTTRLCQSTRLLPFCFLDRATVDVLKLAFSDAMPKLIRTPKRTGFEELVVLHSAASDTLVSPPFRPQGSIAPL